MNPCCKARVGDEAGPPRYRLSDFRGQADLTLREEKVTLRFKDEVALVKMPPPSVPKPLITDGRFDSSRRY